MQDISRAFLFNMSIYSQGMDLSKGLGRNYFSSVAKSVKVARRFIFAILWIKRAGAKHI